MWALECFYLCLKNRCVDLHSGLLGCGLFRSPLALSLYFFSLFKQNHCLI